MTRLSFIAFLCLPSGESFTNLPLAHRHFHITQRTKDPISTHTTSAKLDYETATTSISISPVKTNKDIKEAVELSIDTFFDWNGMPQNARTSVIKSQISFFVNKYGISDDPSNKQAVLLIAKEGEKLVGCASVSSSPYCDLRSPNRLISAVKSLLDSWQGTSQSAKDNIRDGQSLVPVMANVGVAREARRRGIGEMLAAECEAVAAAWGYDEIALSVWKTNLPAQKLYSKVGYSLLWDDVMGNQIVVSDGKVYPCKKVELHVMTKPLPQRGLEARVVAN